MKNLVVASLHPRLSRAFVLAIALFAGLTEPAWAGADKSLVAGTTGTGLLPASTPVRATIYLQPDAIRVADLNRFLLNVQTPSSTEYRHWLTPAQFATRFGASDAQIARVSAFAYSSGLSIESVSGLRIVTSGSAAQVESAFAPSLHQAVVAGRLRIASSAIATVPATLTGDIASVGSIDTVPETSPLTLAADGTAMASGGYGSLDDLATAVEANSVRVLAIGGSACTGDFTEGDRTAFSLVLREAAAQGITTLAQSACSTATDSSFPASLSDAVAASIAADITGEIGFRTDTPRPLWQNAPGLPPDAYRHEPDLAVSSLAALAATFTGILAEMDAAGSTAIAASKASAISPSAESESNKTFASGSAGNRLGNVAQTLYQLAPMKGLYVQPDATATGLVGNWETTDGLGVVDLTNLAKWFPRGTLSTYITVGTTPSYATHGSSITFSAEVKDVSGQGTSVPSGTVTFVTSGGVSLGSATLTANGTGATASVSSAQIPAGTYNVTATYSGDSEYSTNSNQTSFTVGPEEGTLSAAVAGTAALGGTIQVTISDKSTSGVGTPSVTGYVIPQGISDSKTYSVALTGSNGTATGSVSIPASVAGSITLLVGCTSSDPNFTCYNSFDATATVSQATPMMTLTTQPNPIVTGLPVLFTATVTGTSGVVTPTGTVIFFDNGVNIGQGGVNNTTGVVTTTVSGLSASTSHNFTATYYGDNNYVGAGASANATPTYASTTVLTVNPNPPVSGSTTTLTAVVASGSANSTAIPTGTVTFYQDGIALSPSSTVSLSGVATYTSTVLSGAASHTYYAIYSGDATYLTSQSASVFTAVSGTIASITSLTISPNPPVNGSTTTLTAAVASGSASSTAVPTGTVTFYQDDIALSPVATINSSGTASFSSTALSSSSAHIYIAAYGGNTIYAPSTSAPVVAAASAAGSTSTTLVVTPSQPALGSITTLTATIDYVASGTSAPTGTVTFYDTGTALTPAVAVVNGTTATFTSTTISGAMSHIFTAKYSGDTNYATSTSAAIITPATTGTVASTITIAANPTTVATGGSTTLTATVASASSSTTAVPTGLVEFISSLQGLLGTATLNSGGVATLSPTLSTAGTGTITAIYVGDTTYVTSTTATGVAVTVTSATVTPTITLVVSPTRITYGGSVTLSTTVTGTPTTGTALAGTITWTVTPNAGGTAITYKQVLTATSATTATASETITTPAVGTYTVTATCAGTNFTCSSLSSSAGFTVVKTGTTTTVDASPNPPVSGSPELLTAYIAGPSSATLTAECTGTVAFYVNGASVGSATVSADEAQLTITLPLPTKNLIYAAYSGDTNCSASTSTTLILTQPPVATTSTLTTNNSSALYTANVTLNIVVSAIPTATNANPGYPTGTVTFYDAFNGSQTRLGSATLIQNGPYSSVSTFSTTGLLAGNHSIIGVYAGATSFTTSTSDALLVNITDFTVTFAPSVATTTAGQTVSALATVVPVNGFSGQVVLGCVPPSGSATACAFSPAILTSGGGVSALTITTTKTTGSLRWPSAAAGVTFAVTFAGLLWPGRRRRLFVFLTVLLSLGLIGAAGCTTVRSTGGAGQIGSGSGAASSGGTPSGTLQFSITASGTDGKTVDQHNMNYFVTVQ